MILSSSWREDEQYSVRERRTSGENDNPRFFVMSSNLKRWGNFLIPWYIEAWAKWVSFYRGPFNALVQERRNSSALAMELCLSCTNPSIYKCMKSFVFCFKFPWRLLHWVQLTTYVITGSGNGDLVVWFMYSLLCLNVFSLICIMFIFIQIYMYGPSISTPYILAFCKEVHLYVAGSVQD